MAKFDYKHQLQVVKSPGFASGAWVQTYAPSLGVRARYRKSRWLPSCLLTLVLSWLRVHGVRWRVKDDSPRWCFWKPR